MPRIPREPIPNEQVIPIIETDIFSGDDTALMAVKRLNASEVIAGSDPVALAYAQLRANVYIDQRRILHPRHKRPDGGEHDEDDRRSAHFVGLENRGDGRAAVTGSMRLIKKSEMHPRPLPIESFFAGGLQGSDIGFGAIEASRFISRNDIRRRQAIMRSALISTGLAHSVAHNWRPCMAIIEEDVERMLNLIGVPIRRIAEPRVIKKYNSINLGIEIDTIEFGHRIGRSVVDSMLLAEDDVNIVWRKQDEQKRAS